MTFYNTIELNGKELQEANAGAKSQEEEIYLMMKLGGEFTAWELKELFPKYEITSIRRGLWNLENRDQKIERTGFVKDGGKGKPVGKYRVRKQGKLF